MDADLAFLWNHNWFIDIMDRRKFSEVKLSDNMENMTKHWKYGKIVRFARPRRDRRRSKNVMLTVSRRQDIWIPRYIAKK